MHILEKLKPLALLVLRLVVAAVFLASGYDKLFRAPVKWLAWFPQHGFPSYFTYVAGSLEFFGAILLVLGLLTRTVGLLLTIQMAIAMVKVSLPHAGIYNLQGYEFPLVLVAACFTLAILGGGLFSVDAATFERGASRRTKARA